MKNTAQAVTVGLRGIFCLLVTGKRLGRSAERAVKPRPAHALGLQGTMLGIVPRTKIK